MIDSGSGRPYASNRDRPNAGLLSAAWQSAAGSTSESADLQSGSGRNLPVPDRDCANLTTVVSLLAKNKTTNSLAYPSAIGSVAAVFDSCHGDATDRRLTDSVDSVQHEVSAVASRRTAIHGVVDLMIPRSTIHQVGSNQ